MKRVKSACIVQTLHFMLKEDEAHAYAVKLVQENVKRYKDDLDRKRTKYRILTEKTLEDGSVMIEIKKQYSTSPVGNYLD
ncbi:MAG: hypothetical protein IKT67_04995 [Lachnospiraceae bacterium]|nr:hypothetical protein [Lachnospiraceae bacterium]